MTVMPSSTPSAAAEEVPTAPTPAIEGDTGDASSSIPPPILEETEVIFGWRLRSGAEPEAAPVPLPRVLSRAHQALHETEAAILREWEALEAEHQCLSDWRTQLEECTKAASRQFASERSELERDCKDYKRDLQKVFARELEASCREKRLVKREEALSESEALTTELQAKLKALDQTVEAQRVQQVEAIEKIKNGSGSWRTRPATLPSPRRTSRRRMRPWIGKRRISPGGRRISPSGRKCLKGGRCCWPSMSSRWRRRSGSWRSRSASSKRRRRRWVPRRRRPPRRL
jgi:hypothetical protein